jgi:hypothetical protein
LIKSGGARPSTPVAALARTPVGIDVGIGAAVVVAAGLVAAAVPAADGWARVAVLAVVTGLFAALTVDPVAVAVMVLLAWLVDDGFLVDRLGQLGWRGWPDLYRFAALVAAGGLGLAAGGTRLLIVRARARRRSGTGRREPLAETDEEGEERRDG